LPVREHAQETTTVAEKEYLSRKRKEFSQEQKRKEKEKRQRIINREKKRAVKRIHLKGLQAFLAIAPQFVYIAESASATNKQQSPLLKDLTYNIIHRLKEHPTFCILLSKTIRSFSASQKNLSLSSMELD
jgi:hypothetical protein